MAPVVRALRADPGHFAVRLCVTAQHRDLLDPLLHRLDLHPDDDLDVMRPDQTLPELTAGLFAGLAPVIDRQKPDLVMVQGDTTSAMVAAMTAFYAGVPVAHVEAGLRTGQIDEPFPEEMNRLLIARIARWHFAPTDRARANLLAEGIEAARVFVTGNSSIDALDWALTQPPGTLTALDLPAGARIILVTIHRRESFGQPLERICEAIRTIAAGAPANVCVVCTVHPNPHVEAPMRRILGGVPNVRLTPPLDHPDAVALLARSYFVMTDSGGLQEEAPRLGKPVLVLRDTTERPEGIEAGVAALVGREPGRIVPAARALMDDAGAYAQMARAVSPYGDGQAGARIAGILRTIATAR